MNKFLKNRLAVILVGFLASVGSVSAALPLVVGTTMTGIQADGLALIDLVWPVVGAIVGGFLLIKIFKRGAAKI
jgi:hypothetical protein